jgi:sulfide:quinone oxidoreductase
VYQWKKSESPHKNQNIIKRQTDRTMKYPRSIIFLYYTVTFVYSLTAKSPSSVPRQRLVLVGGGIGGLSAAFDAKHQLPRDVQVVVVSDRPDFSFTPSNPWIAVGKRKPQDIQLHLEPILEHHGIDFINARAKTLLPEKNKILLEGGSEVEYDYLVIATGPKLGFADVPGLKEHGHSVCTTPHAVRAFEAFQELVKNPGPIVVGATQGASCFGPAYEYALLLKHELRRRGGKKLVDMCPMTFITSEPYVGHLGLQGAGESSQILEDLCRKNNIELVVNAQLVNVQSNKLTYEKMSMDGKKVTERKTIPSKLTMFIPPFHGHDVWKNCKGLTDSNGMILTDEHQQSPMWHNIFGVGICVALPPVEKTPVPTGAPKTGYMIESMGTAAIKNIKTMIKANTQSMKLSQEPELHTKAKMNGLCITDFGNDGAIFLTLPQLPPRNGKSGVLVSSSDCYYKITNTQRYSSTLSCCNIVS